MDVSKISYNINICFLSLSVGNEAMSNELMDFFTGASMLFSPIQLGGKK